MQFYNIILSVLGLGIFLIYMGSSDPEASYQGENEFTEYSQVIPSSNQSIDMVPILGGEFLMGSPDSEIGRNDNEGAQRRVKVDSFWMGKYEVSWQQYELFMREEISRLTVVQGPEYDVQLEADAISLPTPPYVDMSFGMGRDGFPVINVTHYAAVMFTKWLSAKTGHFYRLPTEAEWEYACRAGSETAYHFGENQDELDQYDWYRKNSNRSYNRPGRKKPNAFGLYDMQGNVAEWTMDQYHEDYFERLDGVMADNPWFRPVTLYPRSVRGGSWMDEAEDLRCAKRRGSHVRWQRRDPQFPKSLWWLTDAPFVGFRVIRPKETPSQEKMEQYWIEAMEGY